MKKIHLTKTINSNIENVWDKIIGKDTYPIWTKAFGGNSQMIGDWIEGETVRFMGDETNQFGMVSVIEKLSKPTFLSIRHIGQVVNGVDDLTSPEVQKWIGLHENYTLEEKDGLTTFTLDMDMDEEYYDMMTKSWERALGRLKNLCEKGEITKVSINTEINSNIDNVWEMWANPDHITKWNYASDTWECPTATNDVVENGIFSIRMQEKANPSNGFDLSGIYIKVDKPKYAQYMLDDGRIVEITFEEIDGKVKVTQVFEAEQTNSDERQKSGWQAILDNFKKYVESKI